MTYWADNWDDSCYQRWLCEDIFLGREISISRNNWILISQNIAPSSKYLDYFLRRKSEESFWFFERYFVTIFYSSRLFDNPEFLKVQFVKVPNIIVSLLWFQSMQMCGLKTNSHKLSLIKYHHATGQFYSRLFFCWIWLSEKSYLCLCHQWTLGSKIRQHKRYSSSRIPPYWYRCRRYPWDMGMYLHVEFAPYNSNPARIFSVADLLWPRCCLRYDHSNTLLDKGYNHQKMSRYWDHWMFPWGK